jgi:hypothetical protein
MDLYLSGAEHNYYRSLLAGAGIKNVCLDFSYVLRTPNLNWKEELAVFDKVMIIPGNLSEEEMPRLIDFLNNNQEVLDFCLDVPEFSTILGEETEVPVIPIFRFSHYVDGDYIAVLKTQTEEIFFNNHEKELQSKYKVHGFEWLHKDNVSANSSMWLLGMRGITFYFDGKQLLTYPKSQRSVRVFLARKYNHNKFIDIDLDAIKKEDWREVAKLNLVAWSDYIKGDTCLTKI